MRQVYLGIDPGKDGALTILIEEDDMKCDGVVIVPYDADLYITNLMRYKDEIVHCILESVHAMPGQGSTSMFNFGQNFGFIQGVLKTLGIPYELVPPQKWKKEFSVTADKNTSINVAKRLFPGVSLKRTDRCTTDHDGMAESLLMAEYGRRKYVGRYV